jgi:sensor domain CHASE-containing protein
MSLGHIIQVMLICIGILALLIFSVVGCYKISKSDFEEEDKYNRMY